MNDRRTVVALQRWVFPALIIAQAAHSFEEVQFRLYDVLAPPRLIGDFIGPDRQTGFALANVALVLIGLGSWWFAFRYNGAVARALMWFWTILELANGVGHILLAFGAGGYFPGLATAPLLLILALWLGRSLWKTSGA